MIICMLLGMYFLFIVVFEVLIDVYGDNLRIYFGKKCCDFLMFCYNCFLYNYMVKGFIN